MSHGGDSNNRLALFGALALPAAGVAYFAARRFWTSSAPPPSATPRGAGSQFRRTPANPLDWTSGEVRDWLRSNAASDEVVKAFTREDIDGAALPMLTDQYLIDMGVGKIGQRLRVIRSIRTLLGMPLETPTPSALGTPAPTPTASIARDRGPAAAAAPRHVDPTHQGHRAVYEADEEDEDDDGDEVVHEADGDEAADDAPALTRLHSGGAHAPSAAGGTEMATIAGTLRAWKDVLQSDKYKQANYEQKSGVLQEAARTLSTVASAIEKLPTTQHTLEIKKAAAEMWHVIDAANNELHQKPVTVFPGESGPRGAAAAATAAPSSSAAAASRSAASGGDQEGVLKVTELLEQFQQVLTAPELLSVPAEQRVSMCQGVSGQLVKIRDNVLPALPAQHRVPLARSIDALLNIAAKLQDPAISQQLAASRGAPHGANGPAPGSQRPPTATTSTGTDAARTVSPTAPPQPASLNFIVQRMRQVFEEIKGPEFMGSSDPARLRDHIAAAARQVHALSREGQHLPDEQRQVVEQVANNIMSVLTKLAESAARTPAQQQAPQAPPQQQRSPQAGEAARRQTAAVAGDVRVGQLLSRQLVAMLNVLKSEQFAAAAPPQRMAVAKKMLEDLDKMAVTIQEQPADVAELLQPTYSKLREYVIAFADVSAKEEAQNKQAQQLQDRLQQRTQQAQQPPVPPARQRQVKPQQQTATATQAAAAPGQQAGDVRPSPQFLQLNDQMKEIVAIVRSAQFNSQPSAGKLDVIVQCQQVLGSLLQRVPPLSAQEQDVIMHNASQVNSLLKAVAEPLVDAAKDEAGAEGERDSEDDEGQADEEEEVQETERPVQRTTQSARNPIAAAAGTKQRLALAIVQRVQTLFNSINADAFLDASPRQREQKAAALNRELVELTEATQQLEEEQREGILPLLSSLAGVLGKLSDAVGSGQAGQDAYDEDEDEEAEGEAEEEGDDLNDGLNDTSNRSNGDGNGQEPGARREIFAMAENTTKALQTGRLRINSIEGVEQLSQLLSLLDRCDIRNDDEFRIRSDYQNAVEKAIQTLTAALETKGGDYEDEEGEVEEEAEEEAEQGDELAQGEGEDDEAAAAAAVEAQLTTVLRTLNETIESANSEQQLAPVLPHLTQIANSGIWKRNPQHIELLAQAMKTIESKRAEWAGRGASNGRGKAAMAAFKAEIAAVVEALKTTDRQRLPGLMGRLTHATDSTNLWKADPQAVGLVNAAIRGIQDASRRLDDVKSHVEEIGDSSAEQRPEDYDEEAEEEEGEEEADDEEDNGTPSRLAALLITAANRIRSGADPTQFIDLGVQVSSRREQLSRHERHALDSFEEALSTASGLRSPLTPAGQRRTPPNPPTTRPALEDPEDSASPPNTPASPPANVRTTAAGRAMPASPSAHEKQILDALRQVKTRIQQTAVSSLQDVAPYIALISRLREGQQLTPSTEAAVKEIEDLLRERVSSLKTRGANLRNQAKEMKGAQLRQLLDIVTHPSFKNLDHETRTSAMRKCTSLLGSLTPDEQQALSAEASQLIAALEDATAEASADEDANAGAESLSDMQLLPRIVERLSTPDFMSESSVFEIAAIAKILSRLDDSELIASHPDFSQLVHQASHLFSERATNFQGTAKSSKAVSCPLNLTGMESSSLDHTPLVRYTLFSPEEAEDYTVDEATAARFARATPAGGEARVDAETLEQWRDKSVALLFCFEKSPLDPESDNPTAQSEVTYLAEVLEEAHGFKCLRCFDEPTPLALTEAFASLAGGTQRQEKLERLFIYFQNPVVKKQLPPAPEHVFIFGEGVTVPYKNVIAMAKDYAKHIVIYHDTGCGVEVVAWTEEDGLSHLVGASVTEAAYLVSNASRCWLYDGLVTPTLLEALSVGARTLCAEDLVNTFVRTLIAKDGADGPHLTQSAASGRAFFAPGLEATEA
jgi:hypothetical protein